MGRVKAGSLRLQEAAELLGLSYRQAKRVWARYRGGGAKALQHGNCGRVSNRAHPEEFRQAVLVQVGRRYADFGPTLAAEHLEEEDGLQVAAETLRRWMKAAGLWRRQRARKPYRQRRMRKPHFGELVQLDASFHPWLEDRAANGCLMHMVDDATGTVLCQFSAGETTWAAAAEADYHRQRPTARQLDDVFWLEEERVLSEDWVVRYKNRLLQLARQNRHWAPAQSRVRVRENEPGHIVIHYRGQSLPFREIPLASSTARSRGRGAAPSPATPSPKPTAAAGRPHRSPAGNHPWRQGWQNMKTPAFSPAW